MTIALKNHWAKHVPQAQVRPTSLRYRIEFPERFLVALGRTDGRARSHLTRQIVTMLAVRNVRIVSWDFEGS